MSVGALDFGLIVDGVMIFVETCLRRFGEAQYRFGSVLNCKERFDLAATASSELSGPSMVGVLISILVNVSIFALTGGKGRRSSQWRWLSFWS